MLDERHLTERLVSYDTSRPDGLIAAAGFVKGWLESCDIPVRDLGHNGLPLLYAEVGPTSSEMGVGLAANVPGPDTSAERQVPTVIFHGHLDVVPGRPEQFTPRVEGDRLIGRGSYDMKGGLASMMCALKDVAEQDRVRVRFVCVPDEESEDLDDRSSDAFVAAGFGGDFAITGEPTNMHIGIEAKGVLVMRIIVHGRAAHSSTPWLGDNAVLKAIDVFRAIESLPFSRVSSQTFDRPSINLGRIEGGDALNKVPDRCVMHVDVRYLPGQDPGEILEQIRKIPAIDVERTFIHPTVTVSRDEFHVRALHDAVARSAPDIEIHSVGRDGASDAASFVRAGIPAVEFGPGGGGHHGPDEWVSLASLSRYRRALADFVRILPEAAARADRSTAADASGPPSGLRAVRGGRS